MFVGEHGLKADTQ